MELSLALQDKTKTLLSTQEMYEKLRRRAMPGQVQYAATDAADQTVEASMAGSQKTKPPVPLFSKPHQSSNRQVTDGNGGDGEDNRFQFTRNDSRASNRVGFGSQETLRTEICLYLLMTAKFQAQKIRSKTSPLTGSPSLLEMTLALKSLGLG